VQPTPIRVRCSALLGRCLHDATSVFMMGVVVIGVVIGPIVGTIIVGLIGDIDRADNLVVNYVKRDLDCDQ